MPRAVSADHDDDDGGIDGNTSDRLGFGAGAESRRALDVGRWRLFFFQIVTLFRLGCLHYLEDARLWFARRLGRTHEVSPPDGKSLPDTI
jgi:hypothetical protein